MKKYLIMGLVYILLIATPTDLKLDINVFEDEEIIKKYEDNLKEINSEDYEVRLGKNNIFLSNIDIDDSVINSEIVNEFKFFDYNFKSNYTFNIKNLELVIERNGSEEFKNLINESINKNELDKFFVNGNKDIEKFNKFKTEIIEFANLNISRVGKLEKGEFINLYNDSKIYNNVIEIDID